jgi:hypothetical protein
MSRAGVHDITSSEFDIYEKKDEVIFLYFYDQATTSEDFVLSFCWSFTYFLGSFRPDILEFNRPRPTPQNKLRNPHKSVQNNLLPQTHRPPRCQNILLHGPFTTRHARSPSITSLDEIGLAPHGPRTLRRQLP